MSKTVASAIGASGRTRELNAHASRTLRIDRDIGLPDIESGLTGTKLKIDAAVGDFNRREKIEGEAAGCAQTANQFHNIPGAFVALHQVQRGFHKMQTREPDLAEQQLVYAEARLKASGVGKRFEAIARVLVDGDFFQRKPGEREKPVICFFKINFAAEGFFQGSLNALTEVGGVDKRPPLCRERRCMKWPVHLLGKPAGLRAGSVYRHVEQVDQTPEKRAQKFHFDESNGDLIIAF